MEGDLGGGAVEVDLQVAGGLGLGLGDERGGPVEALGAEELRVVEVGAGDALGVLRGGELHPVVSGHEAVNEGGLGGGGGLLVGAPVVGDGAGLGLIGAGGEGGGGLAVGQDEAGEGAKASPEVVGAVEVERVAVRVVGDADLTGSVQVELSVAVLGAAHAVGGVHHVGGRQSAADGVGRGRGHAGHAEDQEGAEDERSHPWGNSRADFLYFGGFPALSKKGRKNEKESFKTIKIKKNAIPDFFEIKTDTHRSPSPALCWPAAISFAALSTLSAIDEAPP